MLRELAVENIAVIDSARIDLKAGFSVLTGETGAGKSLLTDAIALALGSRADSDIVRSGSSKATISLVVDLRTNSPALAKCAELGIELEEGILFIRREISAEGRSSVRLNNWPSTVGALREIGNLLVDLHGQHEHQALLNDETHIGYLDSWIGHEANLALIKVRQDYEAVEAIQRALRQVRVGQREREQRLDILKFQVEEIAACNLQIGESGLLENQILRLKHVEKLATGLEAMQEVLAGEEVSAAEAVQSCLRQLEQLKDLDPSLDTIHRDLATASVLIEESVRAIRDAFDGLNDDPQALEITAARLDTIQKLKRKYGDSEEAVLQFAADAQAELDQLLHSEESEESLVHQLEQAESSLQKSADHLSRLRQSKAVEFAASVQTEIRELGMPRSLFEVEIAPKPIQSDGQDAVRFLFTSNLGEGVRPLSKVASGGELSRLMLAIKAASAGRAGVPSLIFDEVDTGLSGKSAAVTASKLRTLAQHYQVLVISHLPQMASQAEHHLLIDKQEVNDRTVIRVKELDRESRVREIARLLAGEEIGETALANARELLRSGEKVNLI